MDFGEGLWPPIRILRNLCRGLLSIWRRGGLVSDRATSLGFADVADQSHHSKSHCILRLKPEPHRLKGDSKPRVHHVEAPMTLCTRVSTLTLLKRCGSNLPSLSPASGFQLLFGYAHSS